MIFPTRLASGVLACAVLLSFPACRRRHTEDAKAKPSNKKSAGIAERDTKGDAALLKKIEAFTGARTKIIWTESQDPKKPDPFSFYDDQILKGLDTRDPRGEHPILPERGNYSRPLISRDGETILYSRKLIDRKGKRFVFDLAIFRTDWKGSRPEMLREGYALDTWRDPATGLEWVYAATDVGPQRERNFNPEKIIRFPLNDPKQVETVWDDGPLSPENIQLSRDGRRACALLPWPKAGVLDLGDHPSAHQYAHGCWPSQSPDNSHVSWVFDGSHKSATFFANNGAKSWSVNFSDAPQFRHSEVYHPRWTNHARFIVLTGPYLARRGGISGGGRSAQVNLARLAPDAGKVEDWLQVSDDDLGEAYPDAWIEGGDKSNLSGFRADKADVVPAVRPSPWPASADGLIFLWTDGDSLNSVRAANKALPAQLEAGGAARRGRFHDLLLDGGSETVTGESDSYTIAALKDKTASACEMLVVPSDNGTVGDELLPLFAMPGITVATKGRTLIVNQATAGDGLPAKPFHLAVVRSGSDVKLWLDGREAALNPAGVTAKSNPGIILGGGWPGGVMRIAVFNRALSTAEVAANAAQSLAVAAKFAPAPPRVTLTGKLLAVSPVPALEDIEPYTGSLVVCLYEVGKVTSGAFPDKRVLVKHWGLLNRQPTAAFPREVGKSYELTLESEAAHPELKGERVSDESGVFDLQPWIDVATPKFK